MGNTCSTEINCDWNFTQGAVVHFDADPDVAGIGVIAAFFISAWLTFVIALFTYNLVDGVMGDDNSARIDRILRDLVLSKTDGTLFARILSSIRARVTKPKMQEVCLMLADQQLVTGASVLIVGYMKHCEITQYHFYIAANLTLVAFATYQSVLLIVSDVLRDNIRRGWRLAWITTIFGCVLLLNFVIYNDNFLAYQHFGLSMDCLWRQLPEDFTEQETAYVVFGILMDLWSGYSIVFHLYPELHAIPPFRNIEQAVGSLMNQPTYLYRKVQRQVRRPYETVWPWKLIEWPTWLLFIVSFTLREISSSLYVELARIFLYLYQTAWAVSWARDNAASNGRDGPEDSWGFGQILPLLLLALLLFSFIEAIYGMWLELPIVFCGFPCEAYWTMLMLTSQASGEPAALPNNAQHIRRADTTGTADTETYEEKLYEKNWFLVWMFLVLSSLFAVVVALSVKLENGVPV